MGINKNKAFKGKYLMLFFIYRIFIVYVMKKY